MGDLERLCGKVCTGRAIAARPGSARADAQQVPPIKALLDGPGADCCSASATKLTPCQDTVDRHHEHARRRAARPGLGRRDRPAGLHAPSSTSCARSPAPARSFSGAAGARVQADRHHEPQGGLQPRLRLLPRSLERAPRQGARRVDAQADARQRRALHHRGAEALRGDDPDGARTRRWRSRRRSSRRSACAVAEAVAPIQNNARALAALDVIACFAEVAERNGYVRPTVDDSLVLDIEAGRHPVVEQALPAGDAFIPNSVRMAAPRRGRRRPASPGRSSSSPGRTWPARASCSARPALIVLLAQVGCFVPARARPGGRRRRALYARRRERQPGRRRVHVSGRDERDGQHPQQRDRAVAAPAGRGRPRHEHVRRA